MILYYGVTPYHFLCFIVDKITRHPNDTADLLLPERVNFSQDLEKNLKKLHIFNKIILYKEFFPKEETLTDEALERIKTKTIDLINGYQLDIGNYSEVNVACDHLSFGLYLNIKKIKYNFWEDGRGRLSTDDVLLEHLKKINIARYELIQRYKLLGHSDCVINRFGDTTSPLYQAKDPRDVNFTLMKLLSELNDELLNKICFCFKLTKNLINDLRSSSCNSTLLVTQHYLNLGLLSRDEQIKLYSQIVDFFSVGNLYIKIHPSDIQVPYLRYFPNAKLIPSFCPSELIAIICPANKFKKAISVSSTSIDAFTSCSQEIICFDQQLESDVNKIVKHFVISELLKFKGIKEIYAIGVNIRLLNAFSDIHINNISPNLDELASLKGEVLIIGDVCGDAYATIKAIMHRYKNNWNAILFADFNEKGEFVNNHNLMSLRDVTPIEIRISNEDYFSQAEYIYVYSKIKNILAKFKASKYLNVSKIKIEVDMQYEKDLQALRGINRALEERLRAVTMAYKELAKEKHDRQDQNEVRRLSKFKLFSARLEDCIVRLTTTKKKYEKYKSNREQYFKDAWLTRRFMRK